MKKTLYAVSKVGVVVLFVLYILSGNVAPILVGFTMGFYFTMWFFDHLDKKYSQQKDA